jgi:predicted nucleic acid-binding protein
LRTTPESIEPQFKGVFRFFERFENGTKSVFLPEIVLFQTWFVLTSFYKVPSRLAAEKLAHIIMFKGVHAADKTIAAECLRMLMREDLDIVDAWILSYSAAKRIGSVFSFDKDLSKRGLRLEKVE